MMSYIEPHTDTVDEETEMQRYLYDLNGYIVIKDVLTDDQVSNLLAYDDFSSSVCSRQLHPEQDVPFWSGRLPPDPIFQEHP